MKFVATEKAAAAVGPFEGTAGEGTVVFISGQLPMNMETGELETDIEKATLACLTAVEAIVEEAGGAKENLAKLTARTRYGPRKSMPLCRLLRRSQTGACPV